MSDSAHSPPTRKGQPSTVPRAVIHKKILDTAESKPDATIEEIATATSGASIDLVEQVLEEYGDPATDGADESEGAESELATSEGESASEPDAGEGEAALEESDAGERDAAEPDTEVETAFDHAVDAQLSDKQRSTLRAIYDEPEATQRDLAERFGVSSATICNRVNGIPGFEWSDRERFVTAMAEQGALSDTDDEQDGDEAVAEQLAELTRRLERLENRSASPVQFGLSDPELAHKVLHACFHSDRISEDEELQLLRELTASGADER